MIIELVKAEVAKAVDEIAQEVLADEQRIVGAHSRTGAAVGSLHIEVTGEFSRFIGANVGKKGGGLHAYYLDEGNGGKTIYPKRKKALKFSDGSLHASASPYKGIHWVQTVASHF